MKVLAFAGTRADLFPLGPVLSALAGQPETDLHVATAIGFAGGTSGDRLRDAGLLEGTFVHHDLGLYLESPDPASQTETGPELSAALAALLERERPEALVILGDRWELLYVVPPAVLLGVRVVHLHGGEVTEGALDERVRHAMTKLADQHCVATSEAAGRVAQLGETADRIHQTGAPGLDRFEGAEPLSSAEFTEIFGRELQRPLLMVTYHPTTAEVSGDAGLAAREVFKGARTQGGTVIFTYPGFDTGREDVIRELVSLDAENDPLVIVRESLGPLYPRIMATLDAVVGNSSSGIIEAASFGKPVIDVGVRQQGRHHGMNVIHTPEDAEAICTQLQRILDPEFRSQVRDMVNPYGDGNSAARIADVISDAGSAGLTKFFSDIRMGDSAP